MIGTRGYPRPQLVREGWTSLDGRWSFALDPEARWRVPAEVEWNAVIRVPFSPETVASGIGDRGMYRACWYRREIARPDLRPGERAILRFGAVDDVATVWVNGLLAGTHQGGYTPFALDITPLLHDGAQDIVVRAYDDPNDTEKPRGKQDWRPQPHAIWYPRTTGIWQTVWLEVLPPSAIADLRWSSAPERWEISLDARIDGRPRDDLHLRVRIVHAGRALVDDSCLIVDGRVARAFRVADPGLDGDLLLWTPESPTLLDATCEIVTAAGEVIDRVGSYAAMRSVGTDATHFLLNGHAQRLRMVLDQGYWPESGLTAPSDDALRADVELTKKLGFNGARKHQKIEDPRYLYWCDRLGLMVWEELPSAYAFTPRAVTRLVQQWTEAIERDVSHPCIVAWVPLNESWGVHALTGSSSQRDATAALYRLTRALDPHRPVIANDGWEHITGDIVGVHDYEVDPARLAQRYAGTRDALLADVRPSARRITLDPDEAARRPIVLSEFGGVRVADADEHAWGYTTVATDRELGALYERFLCAVRESPILAGFCWTQLTDTYQEQNGLLHADRSPKVPFEEIAFATWGPRLFGHIAKEQPWPDPTPPGASI